MAYVQSNMTYVQSTVRDIPKLCPQTSQKKTSSRLSLTEHRTSTAKKLNKKSNRNYCLSCHRGCTLDGCALECSCKHDYDKYVTQELTKKFNDAEERKDSVAYERALEEEAEHERRMDRYEREDMSWYYDRQSNYYTKD
jgi:hypothetical protein